MQSETIPITRRPEQLVSDDRRVIPRYLDFGHPPRVRSILRRLIKLPDTEVASLLSGILQEFSPRHRDIRGALQQNFRQATRHLRSVPPLSDEHKLLIGAYFTLEYSIESAALFNPSIVAHPDQSGLAPGQLRFLLSLRATGEGHVSSIVFRRGTLDDDASIAFDPAPRFAHSARPQPDKTFEKSMFFSKLHEHGVQRDPACRVLAQLPDRFTLGQLRGALEKIGQGKNRPPGFKRLTKGMLWLARANYELHFPDDCAPAETVIFPATEYERQGMEDLRLVRFVDDDGSAMYYGTYTAANSMGFHPMLLETPDFRHFHVSTLAGRYARNKGMALFPRKVNGYYMMISRHDGENLFLLKSHDLYTWNVAQRLMTPREPWELVQLGNCGSPLETEAGWLLITHAVGPLRRYVLGAVLLDRDDPSKVIGRLREPLLEPTEEEREGYVPNVVYSCGSIIHHGQLIVPYAVSDSRTGFGMLPLDKLLASLLKSPPRKKRKAGSKTRSSRPS